MNKKQILIIDDDEDYVLATKTILENKDFECSCAYSGMEGLERIKEVKPDLIILDVMMEHLTAGFNVVGTLRDSDRESPYYHYSKVPILIISSIDEITGSNYEKIAGTQLLPIDGFLAKPVSAEVLISHVNELTGTISFEELLARSKKPGVAAMRLHPFYHGKVSITPKCSIRDFKDFAIWYTPGVAQPCRDIAEHPEKVYEHTNKANFVAVVSDGTRVLGLGNIGPEAGLPVMEGKAILYKYLGGIDAFPLCLNTKTAEEMIQAVKWLEPTFGGINLEDIEQPKCFKILDTLRKESNIPIWHDDQQGTAAVTLAGIINALKIVDKNIGDIKISLIGMGAANTATLRLLIAAGLNPANVYACDVDGMLTSSRRDFREDDPRFEFCRITNKENRKGGVPEAMQGTDVCIAYSKPGPDTIKPEWIASMASDAIVFVCANPVPEIWPWEAKAAGARIVATGRVDFPNQVNNSLGFPGIFRGTLDVMAKTITDEMCIAAATELARCASARGLSEDNILPNMDDWEVYPREATAVGMKAIEQGVARIILSEDELYRKSVSIIKHARDETKSLIDNGFIKQIPEKEEQIC